MSIRFGVAAGKKIAVELIRVRDEPSYITIYARNVGTGGWLAIVDTVVDPIRTLLRPAIDDISWANSVGEGPAEIEVSGFLRMGDNVRPFGYEDLQKTHPNRYHLTFWDRPTDNSQNTTVTCVEI
jgi:hypothetical protein